jgi:hypothetical protein
MNSQKTIINNLKEIRLVIWKNFKIWSIFKLKITTNFKWNKVKKKKMKKQKKIFNKKKLLILIKLSKI